jgi:uncharacterized protein YciI
MPFLIYATDFEEKEKERESLRCAHRKHLKSAGNKLLASGALLADDRITIIGGISLLDTESREEAERFAFEDPLEKASIRKETLVLRWRRRWVDGKFLGDLNLNDS